MESRIDDFQPSPSDSVCRLRGRQESNDDGGIQRKLKLNEESKRCSRAASTSSQSNSAYSKKKKSQMLEYKLECRRSSVIEIAKSMPETPIGWIAFLSVISTGLCMHEIRLQKKLTCPPLVYSQKSPIMDELRSKLSKDQNSNDGLGILTRDIKPSLFVGTRSVIASSAAYMLNGPRDTHLKFRELMTMRDGGEIALDWEIPYPNYNSSLDIRLSDAQLKANTMFGPIDKPVVIILHGINNDASFGYMKSLMRSCSNQGWIACGMNFRGCGGVKLTTPRGYNAGYTGDIRTVVQVISSRLKDDTPMFLIGNSLGANIITKYLGEEGLSGTLPECIKGGVTLGNPLHIHGKNVPWPWGHLLATGVKKMFFQNWHVFHEMSSCLHFSDAIRKVLLSGTIGQLDDEISPFLLRVDPKFPFHPRVGYNSGEDYWRDSSSNRYVQHVPVPLLKLSSQDDFLVVNPALKSLSRCLENPNVLVVKTKCGGHLGWQEAPLDGFGIGKSWADTAISDFIKAILDMREAKRNPQNSTMDRDIFEHVYISRRLRSKL